MSLSKGQKRLLLKIITGAVLFFGTIAADFALEVNIYVRIGILTLAYAVLGLDVMRTAAKNIKNGKMFDENFLMLIATIGAYALGDYTESVAVMLFYQVGEFFQSYAVAKSRRSIKELMDICPEYANLEKDGTYTKVTPFEVEIGDIIVVNPGEKIPIDGIITEGATSLDTASLTGESIPRDAKYGDSVLSGSINLKSTIKIKTTKSFESSTVSKILELVENSGFNKAKSEQFITRFALWYTPLVVAASIITALVPPIFAGGFLLWFKRALIFLVISCPCALVISVPMSFFASIGCASRRGILIKGANYLELLGRLDTVVFDKTGTLTEGNFKVSKIHPVDCSEKELLEMAAAAEYFSNHPVADSIKEQCPSVGFSDIKDFESVAGMGVSAVYRGQKIFAGNSPLMQKCCIKPIDADLAGTVIHLCREQKYMGYIVISDTIKKEAAKAVEQLRKSGIKTCILTGDLKANADSVARELGIDKCFAELLPQDKVKKLEEIIKNKPSAKKAVAYVGDGINDAPVITMADVGIAMGSLGSDAAIEAADIVICDDKLTKLGLAVKICKKTNRIVMQNVTLAIGVKLAVMALGVMGFANMWAAIFADVGVAFIAIMNAMRAFKVR